MVAASDLPIRLTLLTSSGPTSTAIASETSCLSRRLSVAPAASSTKELIVRVSPWERLRGKCHYSRSTRHQCWLAPNRCASHWLSADQRCRQSSYQLPWLGGPPAMRLPIIASDPNITIRPRRGAGDPQSACSHTCERRLFRQSDIDR